MKNAKLSLLKTNEHFNLSLDLFSTHCFVFDISKINQNADEKKVLIQEYFAQRKKLTMPPKEDPLLSFVSKLASPFITLSYLSAYLGILCVLILAVTSIVGLFLLYIKFKLLRKSRQSDVPTIGKFTSMNCAHKKFLF